MSVYPIQATFSRGRLTKELHGRVDIDHYRQGLAVCTNWFVLRHGGLTRRPGTRFAGYARYDDKTAALIPFAFSETQAYAIEFGDLYVRFWTNGGQVTSGGAPYTVATPYAEADLEKIQAVQSGDAIYLACEGYHPRKLVRNSETSWTLSEVEFEDGPYLEEDEKGTYITASKTGAVHPVMTSNTLPSGTVASSGGATDAWKIFDGDISSEPTVIGGRAGWYSYTFPTGTEKVADAYWLISSDVYPTSTPSQWTFEGYDGAVWVILDTRNGETGWGRSEQRYYDFVNETAYSAYRINWTNTDGNSTSFIAELGIHERAEDQTAFPITASSPAGLNGGAGFKTTDVGRSIRLHGTDGKWRWGRIASRSSSTEVSVRLYGQSLVSLSPMARWMMSAFSADDGYPRAVGLYEERLCWGGTSSKPRTVWGSRSADYENHGVSDPVVADDAIAVTMTGGQLNLINWLVEGEDLIIGTSGSMRTLGKATTNAAFSATNVAQKLQSHVGAARFPPVMVQRMAIFADRYGRRLHEFGPDPQSATGGYACPELTILSADLFANGVSRLALQMSPHNVIWAVGSQGKAVSTTYERNQQIVGSGDHDFGGEVESVCVIPTDYGDQAWFIIKRVIDGQTVRCIEYLADPYDAATVGLDACCYFDSSISYDGVATAIVSGAGHLEGETVGVMADGTDIGDAVVSGGEVALPRGRTASKVTLGLRYTSEGETLRLPSAGNQDGSSLGRRKNVGSMIADILDTAGLEVGASGRAEPLRTKVSGQDDTGVLKTGAYRVQTSDSWRGGGVTTFRTNRGYPATLRALILDVEGEP